MKINLAANFQINVILKTRIFALHFLFLIACDFDVKFRSA